VTKTQDSGEEKSGEGRKTWFVERCLLGLALSVVLRRVDESKVAGAWGRSQAAKVLG
jgi:hypothetical protein